jgi:hypothetical protein
VEQLKRKSTAQAAAIRGTRQPGLPVQRRELAAFFFNATPHLSI